MNVLGTDVFSTYLNGLSAQSIFVAVLAKDKKDGKVKGTDIMKLSPKDLASLMGAKKKK